MNQLTDHVLSMYRELQQSVQEEIKASTMVSKSLTDRNDFSFVSDLRWKKLLLTTDFICSSYFKPESKIVLRFLEWKLTFNFRGTRVFTEVLQKSEN